MKVRNKRSIHNLVDAIEALDNKMFHCNIY